MTDTGKAQDEIGDIVRRLNEVPEEVLLARFDGHACDWGRTAKEAAAALEACQADNVRLRKALNRKNKLLDEWCEDSVPIVNAPR